MTDINPFEPWRPRPESRSEDRSEIEPVPPSVPNRRKGQGDQEDSSSEPDWPTSPSVVSRAGSGGRSRSTLRQKVVLWAFLVLLALGLPTLGAQGGNHISRVAASAGVLWLGVLVGVGLLPARRPVWRFVAIVVGTGGAVACWMFVPTTGGVSAWEAYARLQELRALAPGDVAEYKERAPAWRELREEFWTLRQDLDEAERTWVRQTVSAALVGAEVRMQTEPAAVGEELRTLNEELKASEQYESLAPEVREMRRRVLGVQLVRAREEVERRWKAGEPLAAAVQARQLVVRLDAEGRELDESKGLEELSQEYLRALQAARAAACSNLENLYNGRKYAEVARVGDRLARELSQEAAHVDMAQKVVEPLLVLRGKALRARLEAEVRRLEEQREKGDLVGVLKGLEVVRRDLQEEAVVVREQPVLVEVLNDLGRKVVRSQIETGNRELREMVARGEARKVPGRAVRLEKELSARAGMYGIEPEVRSGLRAGRKAAVLARLEEARVKFLAHLRADRYEEISRLGRQTREELGDEASVVGAEGELGKFWRGCAIYADLARKARKE